MENKKTKKEFNSHKDSRTETILINDINQINLKKHLFSISHTQIAKGVASLMLLYHHLFLPGNQFSRLVKNELLIFGIDFRKYSSIFFKITTCTYSFLSGLGLFYSLAKYKDIKDMYKKCIKNFFRLMVIFWIILAFVFPKGLKTGLFNLKYSTVISCIFADYYRKGGWWYIKMHFVLMVCGPLFIRLFQDIGCVKKIIPILIFYFIYSIVKFIKISMKFIGMFNIFFHYFSYFSYIDIILSFFWNNNCKI